MRQVLTASERHDRRLATYRKYNASSKGIARTERFKKAHPEYVWGWEPSRNANRDLKEGR